VVELSYSAPLVEVRDDRPAQDPVISASVVHSVAGLIISPWTQATAVGPITVTSNDLPTLKRMVKRLKPGRRDPDARRSYMRVLAITSEALLAIGLVSRSLDPRLHLIADGAYRRIDWEPTRLLWVLNLRKRSHRERPSVG